MTKPYGLANEKLRYFQIYKIFKNNKLIDWLTDWCLTLLSTLFQSYRGNSSQIHVFPGFHQHRAGALKCLAQRHPHKKQPEDPVWFESWASMLRVTQLPLRHVRTLENKTIFLSMVGEYGFWSDFQSPSLVCATWLTLLQTTNFRLFQTERVCRWQFWFDENGRRFPERIENTVGKGEIAHYEQFLLFSQCFHKTCTADT